MEEGKMEEGNIEEGKMEEGEAFRQSSLQHPVQASMDRDIDYDSRESKFLELQEANNISKAAFKEVMAMALEANTWVVGTPALGSIEEFQQRFRSPPAPGMRVECSIETAILPIPPKNLHSVFMDADVWASTLSGIVHRGSIHSPTGVLSQLIDTDPTIIDIVVVNAEFQLPTPLVPIRKFCFLRCLREIVADVWVIVDVSNDYFDHEPSNSTSEVKCRRRPSGVIIRKHGNGSEVIWIENVEVYEHQVQETMYSEIVNSKLAFCAKRWVGTLLQMFKRNDSKFFNVKMPLGWRAHLYLLNLIKSMEKEYFDCISEAPNRRKWDILADEGIRVLRDVTINADTLDSNNYTALTSFHVQAAPLSVFQFLVKKYFKLQWPSLLEESEELFTCVTEDDRHCITLLKKHHEYMLQDTLEDEFCHFVISSPMTQVAVDTAFCSGIWRDSLLKPSGFAIMPDGSGGLESDASLVTIAVQQELDVLEAGPAIEAMSNIIRRIIGEINAAITIGEERVRL
ncbi:homeobox-leucine zipper protein HDG3-like isoform X2 [Alnus glutinosa]|uniref:homeobox-leucine zipper protein HDG3-like isoform X2 n=1 Tax=Alnus glutinosa TaxID=3517 RepID=UPI002D7A3F13|nr:homeobox-leucine zipper protein HDG3-like isoform X2 [Alnus glutinosa]